MLFINPPFGNYLNLPKTMQIKGSFTLHYRPGLISQIFKTLRYSNYYSGWINKIGLRNKGIDYAINQYYPNTQNTVNSNKLVSIAILEPGDIEKMKDKIPDDMNIEINISCPNTEKMPISKGIECFLNPKREWCIIKLSPVVKKPEIDRYYTLGFRQFHSCNTYPMKEGGLSGPILKPISLEIVRYIKTNYKDTVVIGGGGIRTLDDIKEYENAGADHVSISTVCFSPIAFSKLFYDYLRYKNI